MKRLNRQISLLVICALLLAPAPYTMAMESTPAKPSTWSFATMKNAIAGWLYKKTPETNQNVSLTENVKTDKSQLMDKVKEINQSLANSDEFPTTQTKLNEVMRQAGTKDPIQKTALELIKKKLEATPILEKIRALQAGCGGICTSADLDYLETVIKQKKAKIEKSNDLGQLLDLQAEEEFLIDHYIQEYSRDPAKLQEKMQEIRENMQEEKRLRSQRAKLDEAIAAYNANPEYRAAKSLFYSMERTPEGNVETEEVVRRRENAEKSKKAEEEHILVKKYEEKYKEMLRLNDGGAGAQKWLKAIRAESNQNSALLDKAIRNVGNFVPAIADKVAEEKENIRKNLLDYANYKDQITYLQKLIDDFQQGPPQKYLHDNKYIAAVELLHEVKQAQENLKNSPLQEPFITAPLEWESGASAREAAAEREKEQVYARLPEESRADRNAKIKYLEGLQKELTDVEQTESRRYKLIRYMLQELEYENKYEKVYQQNSEGLKAWLKRMQREADYNQAALNEARFNVRKVKAQRRVDLLEMVPEKVRAIAVLLDEFRDPLLSPEYEAVKSVEKDLMRNIAQTKEKE